MEESSIITKIFLTVGFSDLDGWIKLNGLIGEKKAISSLLSKFNEIETIIKNKNGIVRKFIGDTVVFTFENINDGVSAGKEISSISISVYDKSFHFYTGLATGTIYEVDMGNGVKDIYGKTVNTAALLAKEAKSNKDRIAICPRTISGLNSQS